ncbi:GPR endopeptidase [Viridibacillus sp. FSL R5-0477]|uniref:Germination protease n=1 Tax=Viridibacillus arenosi FSL R5-213 TaxID=1227360 RepID=W4ERD4_9BACL|nr:MULTISPECIES: GPR endopeptidase [Viridibacillus]ETT82371.1 germination protease [Viridibacillus arenosi FSL R5-213]OMC87369.1 GPR endopeptidase [Viridibacillus sp. FSL H7-0596]OMC92530.1 GPR endopeptidase [Viridibacillus arenosi]
MENNKWYRTDLVDETEEFINHKTAEERETLRESTGIKVLEEERGRVKITRVDVDSSGAEEIGKKEGTYFTFTVPTLTPDDEEGFKQLGEVLAEELTTLHPFIKDNKDGKVLIIGLGNKTITPDAVGPLAIDELQNSATSIQERCIIYAPGVTGQTGYETSSFIKALAEQIKPELVIVVDALATRASNRLCKTIQMTDTGIHPGSGVGNMRKEISKETIGCPVTAIGLPTVVDGPVLIADAVDTLFQSIAAKIQEKNSPSSALSVTPWRPSDTSKVDLEVIKPIFGEWSTWPKEERLQLFEESLVGHDRLFVTPKNIDEWVHNYAYLISDTLTEWIEST